MGKPRRVKVFSRKWNPQTKKYDYAERWAATFLQFGCDYEEFESGPGNFTTAIIERDNGKVESVPVDCIQFLEPTK